VAMESTGVYWKPVYRAIRTLSPTRTVCRLQVERGMLDYEA